MANLLRIGPVGRTDGPDFCADCLLKLFCLIIMWWFELLGGNGPFCFEMVYQLQLRGEEVSVLETELSRKTICSSVSSHPVRNMPVAEFQDSIEDEKKSPQVKPPPK